VQMLIRYAQGEAHVWHVVRVPSVEEEDARHLHRELLTLKRDRTRCRNRITGVLTTHGVQLQPNTHFLAELAAARQWNGQPLPPGVVQRVSSEYAHLQFIAGQIKTFDAQRETLLATSPEPAIAKMRQLLQLRGVGINGAWLLVLEFFGWREFKNRRELGALAGLVPTPHQSGDSHREQGISKAGNRPVRGMMIELAWCWLRYQPESELAQWFERRYGAGGKRARKVGIVAVARRLLVAFWRYLESGEIPTGAQLKPTG
jgi:transposase